MVGKEIAYRGLSKMKIFILTLTGCYLFFCVALPRAAVLYLGEQPDVTVFFKECQKEKCEISGSLHTDAISLDQTLITKSGDKFPVRDGNWYGMKFSTPQSR